MYKDKEWEVEATLEIRTSFFCDTMDEKEDVNISKNAVIKCFDGNIDFPFGISYDDSRRISDYLNGVLNQIKALPPAEPKYFPPCEDCHAKMDEIRKAYDKIQSAEPKTGHWILLDECSNSGYYCSECHKKVVKEGWSNTVKKIKYCPNCGIKID